MAILRHLKVAIEYLQHSSVGILHDFSKREDAVTGNVSWPIMKNVTRATEVKLFSQSRISSTSQICQDHTEIVQVSFLLYFFIIGTMR